jgi:hypothetical protein
MRRYHLVVLESQPPVGVYQQRGSPFKISLFDPKIVVKPVMRGCPIKRFARLDTVHERQLK